MLLRQMLDDRARSRNEMQLLWYVESRQQPMTMATSRSIKLQTTEEAPRRAPGHTIWGIVLSILLGLWDIAGAVDSALS
ncbi:hypothetical protein BDW66DRAFT_7736 [Aspergillus desertorum]